MKKHTELLRDQRAYIESIGKEDSGRQRMFDALEENGRGAVVRVCFSVPDPSPPVRVLGYFAAATHATQKYLPEAQLQFIATVHANARINQVPLERSKRDARRLFNIVSSINGIAPNAETDVVYGFDTPNPPEVPMHRIIPILRHEEVSKQLARSAARRNAQYAQYVGAHLVMHDLIDVVEPATNYGSLPVSKAQTLISIGAQSERAFYKARHICRSAPLFSFPDMAESTAQLFTKHVYPPYAYLRHNAQDIFDPALTSPHSLRQLGLMTLDSFLQPTSVQRDLLYVSECVQDGEFDG